MIGIDRLVQLLGVAGDAGDVRAGLAEGQGNRLAESLRGAGHERRLAVQIDGEFAGAALQGGAWL